MSTKKLIRAAMQIVEEQPDEFGTEDILAETRSRHPKLWVACQEELAEQGFNALLEAELSRPRPMSEILGHCPPEIAHLQLPTRLKIRSR